MLEERLASMPLCKLSLSLPDCLQNVSVRSFNSGNEFPEIAAHQRVKIAARSPGNVRRLIVELLIPSIKYAKDYFAPITLIYCREVGDISFAWLWFIVQGPDFHVV